MFIKTDEYTINTDHILYAEAGTDNSASIYFTNGKSLVVSEQEAKELWGMCGRQTLPSIYRKESQRASEPPVVELEP